MLIKDIDGLNLRIENIIIAKYFTSIWINKKKRVNGNDRKYEKGNRKQRR